MRENLSGRERAAKLEKKETREEEKGVESKKGYGRNMIRTWEGKGAVESGGGKGNRELRAEKRKS